MKEFVKKTLSKLNPDVLVCTKCRSKKGSLLEIAWVMEFYRAAQNYLPSGSILSPEVGKLYSNDGVVDLYVSEKKWAIEFLVNSNQMKKYYERFKNGINISISMSFWLVYI